MNTTRVDAAGASQGTTQQVTETAKMISKVKISNPSPLTTRTDAGVGTTTQRSESEAYTLEGSEVVIKP